MKKASSSGWCYHIKKVYGKGKALTTRSLPTQSIVIKWSGSSGHEFRMEMVIFHIFLKVLYLEGIFSIIT